MNSNDSIGASVMGLIKHARPSAIIRRITSVVIFAFKRFADGRFPHIHKEILKGLQPAFTHFDSSTAIILISASIGIGASDLHIRPNLIGFADKSRPVVTMFGECPSGGFRLQASTRFGDASSDIGGSDGCGFSALTEANAGTHELTGIGGHHRPLAENFKPSYFGSDGEWFFSHSDGASLLCLAVGSRRQSEPAAILLAPPTIASHLEV